VTASRRAAAAGACCAGNVRRVTTPARRPTYKTFAVERHVGAPRTAVWEHLWSLLDAGLVADAGFSESVLSLEPPWRRAARLDLAPFPLAEHTVALRDDGDECHLVWAYVVQPPEPVGDGDGADAALARLQSALTAWADRIASRSAGAS
jgi:hypothetical protein